MKDVLDAFPCDRTCQEALRPVLLLNCKDLLIFYGTLIFQIEFITGYSERAGLVLIHLIQPLGKVRERFLVG